MIDEPSFHRQRSLHFRAIELDNICMDTLHHLIYDADTIEVDFEEVEDTDSALAAMKLMGRARIRGGGLYASTKAT